LPKLIELGGSLDDLGGEACGVEFGAGEKGNSVSLNRGGGRKGLRVGWFRPWCKILAPARAKLRRKGAGGTRQALA